MMRQPSISRDRVQEQLDDSSTARGGIVVRVGNQQWIVGSDHATNQAYAVEQVLPSPAENLRTTSKSSKWVQMFQAGATFGLLLGCITMMLAHQLSPRPLSAPPKAAQWVESTSKSAVDAQSKATSHGASAGGLHPTSKAAVHASATTPKKQSESTMSVVSVAPVQIPAVRLYALTSADISNASAANHWSIEATGKQVPNIVIQSGDKYRLLLGMAGYSTHLNIIKHRLAGVNIRMQIEPYRWNARLVESSGGLSAGDAQSVSDWLSAEVSAMNALTAVIVDAAHSSDAAVAYSAASKLLPHPSVLANANRDLPDVARLVQEAFDAHQHQLEQSALRDLMQAYELLQQLH